MEGPKHWSVIDRQRIAECRVFDVFRLTSRSPRTGADHTFFSIEAPAWVNVVPTTPDGAFVMVRQFRHGADALTLETPGGMVDPGEVPIVSGARELLEETGFTSTGLVSLGQLNPNPALFGNRLHVFHAPGAVQVAEIQGGTTEETHVELISRDSVASLVASGRIDHALVVASLALFALFDATRS